MYSKFIVVLFVLSFASGKCGLLNWFSGWTDQLEPQNAGIKCRERRETEEHGNRQEITSPASDKIVSLMDIEEGKLTAETEHVEKTPIQGYSKTKRCPKDGYVRSFRAPIVGAAPLMVDPLPLVKRESEHNNNKMCTVCRNQPTCKLLQNCDECDKYCNEMNVGPTSQDNPIVGMASRIAPAKNDNIFSKTLYPISTYREGETKDIICRIIGITDPTDIETVTIWVTTFSNNPPRAPGSIDESSKKDPRWQENLPEHKLRKSDPKQKNHNESPNRSSHILPVSHLNDGQLTQPQLKPRFNDYNEDEDSFGQIRNLEENIRENPDLIEGPPPFLRSSDKKNTVSETDTPPAAFGSESDMKDNIIGSVNKDIIVQPKEFQSDESDEDEVSPTTVPLETKELSGKNAPKLSLLNRLKELTSPRTNTFPNLKSLRKSDESNSKLLSPPKGGFLQNLLKSRQGSPEKNMNSFTSTAPPIDNMRNIEIPSANSKQNPPTQLSEGSNNRVSDLNVALQDVKAMVKSMQDEAQKDSEKRLLGSPHIENIAEAAGSDVASGPSMNPIHSVVPPHIVDNFKKVNKYIINRAQDALDTIGHQETKEKESKPSDSDLQRDHHSNMTKNLITDFKKMPQFLLKKFEDSLNGFEGKPEATIKVESGSKSSEHGNEQVELSQRFGEDDPNNIDNTGTTVGTQDDNNTEPLLGFPERFELNEETPITNPYKNKLEKYLAELKNKKQKMYSPEKYLKGISGAGEKNSQIITNKDKTINSQELPNLQRSNSPTHDIDRGLSKSDMFKSQHDLEKQRALLKEKVKKYVDDIKFKKNSSLGLDIVPKSASAPSNTLSNTEEPANLEMKPHTPFSRINDIESNANNQFLPTLPSASKTGLDQFTETPSKFMKYIQDLRAKTPFMSTPKSVISPFGTDISPRNNVATVNDLLAEDEPKKHLLKDKIKNYVENLNKRVDERVAETGLPLTPRGHEEFNKLNQMTKPTNLFKPSAQDSKKNLLKEKLKNYVSSLKKPIESKISQPSDIKKIPELARNSLEPQKKEFNALKNKLEGLLRERMAKPSKSILNPLIAEGQPNQEQHNSETASDSNDVVPVFNGAKDTEDNESGNVGNDELATIPNDRLGAANPSEEQIKDTPVTNLQSRGGFAEDEPIDWSNQLGKIVQSSSKPKDIFFIGNGIKLPLQIKQGADGSMDLSVDMEKLCSCYNSTCTRNNAAIEETVGAILEKEAELKNQLNLTQESSDDVKVRPVPRRGFFPHVRFRHSEVDNQNGKSNIFKRSSDINGINMELTTLKNMLQLFTKDNSNPNNDMTNNNLALPKLPTVEEVANELTDFGSKFKDNVRELNKDIAGTFGTVPESPAINEAFSKQTIEANLKKMKDKADEINNKVFKRLEHENNLNQLLKVKNIDNMNKNPNLNLDKYIKNVEREKTLKKLLKELNLSQAPTDNALRQIESQANSIIKNNAGNRINFHKVPATQNSLILANRVKDNYKNALPAIPRLQDRFAEVNDNLAKISDAYQYSKIDALENRLKQLDDEVEKYEDDNEKLFAEESKRFFGGHNNEIIQKEVNLIGKVFSWLKGLSGSSNSD